MKILITYKSFYGSSKQYALWLSEELSCPAISLEKVSKKELADYDLVIHGGGLYAGGISGIGFYKKNIDFLRKNNTNLVVFATGASPYNRKTLREIKVRNFAKELQGIPYFYCEGNYDYKAMNFVHKSMMKMMNKMLTKKIKESEKPNSMDEEFLNLIFSHFERCDKKWISQITDYIKTLQ